MIILRGTVADAGMILLHHAREQASGVFWGHPLGSRGSSLLSVALHLVLVGVLVMALAFWGYLAVLIVVRLACSTEKGERLP